MIATRRILLAAFAAAAVAVILMAAARGAGGSETLQDRVRAVASTLRCPVCQDLSVADSPSAVAREMRERIASELRAGVPADRIRTEFARSYGEWVLLDPPKRGLDLIAWALPFAIGAGALSAGWVLVRRMTRDTPAPGAGVSLEDAEGSAG